MESRLDFFRAEPAIFKVLLSVEEQIRKGSLDLKLKELVKIRASQINACAFCLDMHITAAREAGETDRRLGTVAAWREAPFFSERERAALEWTEALTRVADTHVPDAAWETVRAIFSDIELMELTLVISSINSWNRFAVAFRRPPG